MKNRVSQDSVPTITIDGPSGSGKGTIGQWLAARLGWHFLDSGALYRTLAFYVQQLKIDYNDEAAIVPLAIDLPVVFIEDAKTKLNRIELQGEDITQEIRAAVYSKGASKVASLAQVRQALLTRQRAFAKLPGLIADGRDMGTVVFPQAALKIFLTASQEERAQRRFKQLQAAGNNVTVRRILEDLRQRDERDSKRSVAPLKPASDALMVDTTEQTVAAVKSKIMQAYHTAFAG